MDSPVIGIKIANGTFFPILNSEDRVKKRVILTPVAAEQTDVKIDIFRGDGEGMFNPVYVASLILNNIEADTDNGTEIELLIGINDENILDAEAFDKVSGEKQLLSISLDAVDETDFFEIPDEEESSVPYFNAAIADNDTFDADSLDDDFSMSDEDLSSEDFTAAELTDEDLSSEDFSEADSLESAEDSDFTDIKEESEAEEARYLYDYEKNRSDKKVSALKIAIVFLSIVFLIFLVLLIYTIIKKPAMAEEKIKEETVTEVVVETEKKKPEAPSSVIPPSAAVKKPEPVKEKAVPVPEAKTVKYRIKRGDTLWDISSAYYRTPWLYKKIAKDNNIKNPDLIYADTHIIIKE